jgi:hypothetical protein
MAPPSLRSWLRTFIRHEIDKTLDWKRNGDGNETTLQNQAENGGQIFSDDGSNFRSYVSGLEDGKDLVQIVEVVSLIRNCRPLYVCLLFTGSIDTTRLRRGEDI